MYSLTMKRSVCWIFSYVLIIVQFSKCENTRLRGVSISKQQFYSIDPEWFTCIDGSAKIPFSKVNDDYCDCQDSSDEPGTPACPNGKFHCTNAGHIPIYIPSSRVNDGICDCCDGSDEYKVGSTKCINDCKELGRADREQRRKDAILQNEGFEIRLTYIQHGQAKQKETEDKLSSKKVELAEFEQLKEGKEAIKLAAEEPEKKAKEEHENKWNEYLEEKKKKQEEKAATSAFNQMDVDGDGILTTEEIMLVQGFDSDKDGAVSNEEATKVLGGQSQVDKEAFVTNLWTDGELKKTYEEINKRVEKKQEDTEATDAPQPPGIEPEQYHEEDTAGDISEDLDHDDYDDYDEDYEDEDEHEHDEVDEEEHLKRSQAVLEAAKRRRQKKKQVEKEEEEEKMPDYNENTKKLIEIADKARSEFDEANNKYTELNNEISALEKLQSKDFGPDQEFAILQDQCFEFTDREYTYKLCPFEKSTQRPKNGGAETSLGTWGEWDGMPGEKYTVMKYSRGKGCWNGPDRSTNVKMSCGKENKILSASEPEKCVYQFEFTTPALCTTKVNIEEHDQPLQHGHTEL